MTDERKQIEIKELDEDGTGLAQIATLSGVDHDGDTYAKGAFGEQQVKILAGHSWAGIPIGKGRVFEKGDHAFAEFKLNLDIQAGKEWHQALLFDMKNGEPLTEWSYGFRVLESHEDTRDGKGVRVLEKLDVFEVSPVVKGAGVGTHTVEVKGRKMFLSDADAVIQFAERLAEERKAEGVPFRPAWVLECKALRDRLDALVEIVTKTDEVPDEGAADRLLAEFTAINLGRNPNND